MRTFLLALSLLLPAAALAEAPATPASVLSVISACDKYAADVSANANATVLSADMQACLTSISAVGIPSQWTADGGRIAFRLGPACAATLLSVENGGVKPTDFGGAGPQLSMDLWKVGNGAYAGQYQLHVIVEALFGAGTVNGISTASFIPALAIGYGGYGLVPEMALGFGPRIPMNGKSPVQFTMVGSMAALTLLQEF